MESILNETNRYRVKTNLQNLGNTSILIPWCYEVKTIGKAVTSLWVLNHDFSALTTCRFTCMVTLGRAEPRMIGKRWTPRRYEHCMAPLGARKFLQVFMESYEFSLLLRLFKPNQNSNNPLKICIFFLFPLISTNFGLFPLILETPPLPRGGVLDKGLYPWYQKISGNLVLWANSC